MAGVMDKETIEEFHDLMQGTVQFYYFIQLIGTHIFPNYAQIDQCKENKDGFLQSVSSACKQKLNFVTIVKRIIENKIDMKKIVEDPSEENLQKALKVLELSISDTPLFCTIKPDEMRGFFNYWSHKDFRSFSQNNSLYSIDINLDRIIRSEGKFEGYNPECFKPYVESTKEYIKTLEERIKLFMQVANTSSEELNYKRNHLRHTHPNAAEAIDPVLTNIDKEISACFMPKDDTSITKENIVQFCTKSLEHIKKERAVLDAHRGILGAVEKALKLIISLFIFYPLISSKNLFFHTATQKICNEADEKLNEIKGKNL